MQASSYPYNGDPHYTTPGVFFEEVTPKKLPEFRTGVPAFLGFLASRGASRPLPMYTLTASRQFGEFFGGAAWGFLGQAVRGFFENGGTNCVVVGLPLDLPGAKPASPGYRETLKGLTRNALEALESREDVDLVCFPDAFWAGEQMIEVQCEVLSHCKKMRGRFAILDSNSATSEMSTPVREQIIERMVHHWRELMPTEGALYFPWIEVREETSPMRRFIPPCGHIAGIYARTDVRIGVHKAPANEIVEGAIDLEVQLSDQDQSKLNEAGINCLRALPGRGIRVWGARTLSGLPDWRYVNIRRLFLTLVRWIDSTFQNLLFEPYTPSLWEQIRGRLNSFCYNLFEMGALKGRSAAEAFYVKCDAETNPPVEREAGRVIAEVGLAPVVPAEFIVVRITHTAAGTKFSGPTELREERR